MPTPVPGNSLNKTTANPSKPHSNFDLSKLVAITPRFGVNTPFYSNEVVTDDGKIVIKPSCDTRSYTLKAPMFGNIKKHIAFYQVPLQCLLPFNYQKIVVNSQHGSDVQGISSGSGLVPALNGVNCVVSDFARKLVTKFLADFTVFQTDLTALEDSNISDYIKYVLMFVIRWEMFFSNGNLMSHLGTHYAHLIRLKSSEEDSYISFDRFCQRLLSSIENIRFQVVDDGGTDHVIGSGAKHIRKVLDFGRSHSMPMVVSNVAVASGTFQPIDVSIYTASSILGNSPAESEPFNFGRCLAYQIVNAHFYTNDRIDYVYSADLYRDYISSLVTVRYEVVSTDLESVYFMYNGIKCRYDWLSGFYLNFFLTQYVNPNQDYKASAFWSTIFPYFNAIFGFNYSLRFMDYFVGARPRNLAISGPNTPTDVAVDNNKVSVINTTKAIVAQRFLNAVARVPQNFKDYSEKILGQTPAYDWHDPKYLFSYDMDLFTSEVENTGAGQLSDPNSVTSVLRGRAGNLMFEISNVDRYSYIVGIENFDIRRFYYTTQEKNTMAIDRFDMFIPELQYLGDQSLKLSELVAGSEKDMPFGYQLRDMQYKQAFDECAGGFIENLPGWLFKFDISDFSYRGLTELTISPDFIRSKPEEIDDFYLSLTGLTLASYFHFIEVWNIEVSANRPMVAAPSIL